MIRKLASKQVFVALLRGINVGKAKRVAMADLRSLVEGLGYGDVRTLLNSGNVVFSSAKGDAKAAARRVEKEIALRLGVDSRVTVIGAVELSAVVAKNPLGKIATNPSRHMVAFFPDAAGPGKLAALAAQRWSPEAIVLGVRVAYVWCPAGILESPLFKELSRQMKDGVTTRNWGTVTKLEALAAAIKC